MWKIVLPESLKWRSTVRVSKLRHITIFQGKFKSNFPTSTLNIIEIIGPVKATLPYCALRAQPVLWILTFFCYWIRIRKKNGLRENLNTKIFESGAYPKMAQQNICRSFYIFSWPLERTFFGQIQAGSGSCAKLYGSATLIVMCVLYNL